MALPRISVNTHYVTLRGLPQALTGVSIVHITDTHQRGRRASALTREAVESANQLQPDYVLLTGDYVDHRRKDVRAAAESLAGLRARKGVFGTLGNHDHRVDAAGMAAALEAAGVTLLQNCARELAPGLWLAGVDDLREGEPDLHAALAGIPDCAAAILMSHNPDALNRVPEQRPLLILSGHTHGAQIALPFPSPALICRIRLRTGFVAGWYRRGAAKLFVSRGLGVTGSWPLNFRFRCPAEIAHLLLYPAHGDADRGHSAPSARKTPSVHP